MTSSRAPNKHTADTPEAVYEKSGNELVPTLLSRAMWYESAQHGGPVAALVARAIEATESAEPMIVVRLTVDLLRPVPVEPLRIETRVVRSGRRIQVVEASVLSGGREVTRATGLRMRITDVAVPPHPERVPPSGPVGVPTTVIEPNDEVYFHTKAVEMRSAGDDFHERGPGVAWMRLVRPIVAGEQTSPLMQMAAISDFGNGLGRVLGREHVFMNADLTIHIQSYPRGEWICLQSRSDVEPHGTGLAQSELFDEQGSIGHALQSLFVDTRANFGTAVRAGAPR